MNINDELKIRRPCTSSAAAKQSSLKESGIIPGRDVDLDMRDRDEGARDELNVE